MLLIQSILLHVLTLGGIVSGLLEPNGGNITIYYKLDQTFYKIIPENPMFWLELIRIDEPNSCMTKFGPAKSRLILLAPHCFQDGWVVHELMHGIGLFHEHQRRDRDCYVEVHSSKWNDPSYKINNNIDIDVPYDINSVMHYERNSFMRPAQDYPYQDTQFGRKDDISPSDMLRVNHMYCGGRHFCEENKKLCDKVNKTIQEKGCIKNV